MPAGLDAQQQGPGLPRALGAAECAECTECAAPPGLPTLRARTGLIFHPCAGPLPGTR